MMRSIVKRLKSGGRYFVLPLIVAYFVVGCQSGNPSCTCSSVYSRVAVVQGAEHSDTVSDLMLLLSDGGISSILSTEWTVSDGVPRTRTIRVRTDQLAAAVRVFLQHTKRASYEYRLILRWDESFPSEIRSRTEDPKFDAAFAALYSEGSLSEQQERKERYTAVAVLEGNDIGAVLSHCAEILVLEGIRPMGGGSVIYGMSVPESDFDRAFRLLVAEALKEKGLDFCIDVWKDVQDAPKK